MTRSRYRLDGHTPVPEPNLYRWAAWLESADRQVAVTQVGHLRVSTVFLGLDHRFDLKGPPLLFETMVFDEQGESIFCAHYPTWDEAKSGHDFQVSMRAVLP